jgi:hypothetical protein
LLKGKKSFLKMKLEAVENAHAEVLAAKDKLIALYNEEMRDHFQKMRGLRAYGIACGRTNPDCQLPFHSLGDYLEAKSDSDRKAAQKAVNLCLAHGNFDSTEGKIRR